MQWAKYQLMSQVIKHCRHFPTITLSLSTPWSIKRATFIFQIALWNISRFWQFLAPDIRKELDANDYSFGHFTSILSLHYLVKCRSRITIVWPFTTMSSYWIAHASAQKWLTEKRQTRLATIIISKSYTYHIISSLLHRVLRMSSSSANASGKRWHQLQTAGSTTCISQGSVTTVLKWGGQKYSYLRRVSSWCRTSKIIKIGQRCTELFKQ